MVRAICLWQETTRKAAQGTRTVESVKRILCPILFMPTMPQGDQIIDEMKFLFVQVSHSTEAQR